MVRHRRATGALAAALATALLAPAPALANPGPNLTAVGYFLVVAASLGVSCLVTLGLADGAERAWPAATLGLLLAFLGFVAAFLSWQVAALLLSLAALAAIVAGLGTARAFARLAAVLAGVSTLVALPAGVYHAKRPTWPFALSAQALGGSDPASATDAAPSEGLDAGRPDGATP